MSDYLNAMDEQIILLERDIERFDQMLYKTEMDQFAQSALELVETAREKARSARKMLAERALGGEAGSLAIERAAEELRESFNTVKRILH